MRGRRRRVRDKARFFLAGTVVVGERLCSALAPKVGRKSRGYSARPSITPTDRQSVHADGRRDTEQRDKRRRGSGEREREHEIYFFGGLASMTQFECVCHAECTFVSSIGRTGGRRGREADKSRCGLPKSVNRNCRPNSVTPS